MLNPVGNLPCKNGVDSSVLVSFAPSPQTRQVRGHSVGFLYGNNHRTGTQQKLRRSHWECASPPDGLGGPAPSQGDCSATSPPTEGGVGSGESGARA